MSIVIIIGADGSTLAGISFGAAIDFNNNKNFHVIVVEANPRYTNILTEQKKYYLNKNIAKSYNLYNGTAISTKVCNCNCYYNCFYF